MSKTITIYALKHPKTGVVRYVGKTEQKPEDRLYRHIAAARSGRQSNVNVWLRTLLAKGLRPKLQILEVTTEKRGPKAERFWIEYFIIRGYRLKNMTTGGYGLLRYKHNEEARRKIREARAKQVITEEIREKLRQRMLGNKLAVGNSGNPGPRPQARWSIERKREMSKRMEKIRAEKFWSTGHNHSGRPRKSSVLY